MAERPFDFVVFGSGFAGSIMAMVLRKLGRTVLLLERGSHPRFVIGESSTPFANLLLEKLAERYELPVLKDLSEWGSWQRKYPHIGAGLKRGFTFYHHTIGQRLDFSDRTNQLLVAASPNDFVADTHWYRPDFDHFLVQQAQSLGACYLEKFQTTSIERAGDALKVVGNGTEYRASFIIDASGPNSVMAEFLHIPNSAFETMPPTRTVYAHFRNVAGSATEQADLPPYPPDAAAVHHVFASGWMWMLRFANGITSAGFAHTGPDRSWDDLLGDLPSLQEQFQNAERITPFYQSSRIWFRRARASDHESVLLPSAAAFVDPLLSSGFALTLLGIFRLAGRIETGSDLTDYESATFLEADAVADLVSALYAKMHSFEEFTRLSMLYFAAMSYTETCWRLDKSDRASGFLLTNDPEFTALRKTLCAKARHGFYITEDEIHQAIDPIDIAGLGCSNKRGWHPVDLNDLIQARHKLGATREEVEMLIRKLQASTPA